MFDIKTFKSDIVKDNRDNENNSLNLINGEYPTFNRCGHTTIDLSSISKMEDENMHTLSLKLTEDSFLTLCVMPINEGNYLNIDVKLHTSDERENKLIHFARLEESPGGSRENDININNLNLVALISELKKN